MAKNILESVYGLGDDDTIKSLKRIDKLVGKLDVERKKEEKRKDNERKRDKLHENRLARLKKRQEADKKTHAPMKELFGKEEEKKGNDLWKWLLGAGVIAGGGVLAWMNKDEIGKWIKKSFEDIKDFLKKKIEEWAEQLAKKIRDTYEDTTTPQQSKTPQQPGPVYDKADEAADWIDENVWNKGRRRSRSKVARNINRARQTQAETYDWHLMTPGGDDKEEKALRDYYFNMEGVMDKYFKLLGEYESMLDQLQENQKLLEEGNSYVPIETLKKRIAALRTNIGIKDRQITQYEKVIQGHATTERRLIRENNKKKGRDPDFGPSIFTGSAFDTLNPEGKQTGGVTGQKFRKGNGAPTEYAMNPWIDPKLDPQRRQNGGKIFLHWAASEYDYSNPAYHATVQGDGSVKKTRDYNSFGGGHTSERNSEGIGLSLAAMKGATSSNFGSFPVKKNQYESMAKLAASILTSWGYGPSYVNETNVPTHAEAGRQGDSKGNYGPTAWGGNGERWDLYMLYQGETPGSGGPKIRNMIKGYMGSGDYELETTDGTGHQLPNTPSPARQRTFMEKLQDAFSALGNAGIFAGTVFGGIGSYLLEKLGIDLSGLFSTFNISPEQKQEGGLIKGNAKSIYDRLIMGGMSIPAARGILANIGVETGYTYNPSQLQGRNGPGRGLVQWEKGGRFDTDRINLVDFAKSRGTTWNDLNTQVDFILHEMNTHPEYMRLKPKLNAARNSREATELFLRDYEKAGTPHTDRRYRVADQLDKLNWQGPARVGRQVGIKRVGTGNPLIDTYQGAMRSLGFGKQSGGMINRGRSTTNRHINFQQNQQTFNQSRGPARRQVVVVKRRARNQSLNLPAPAPSTPLMMGGGSVNNIASINEIYSVVGMS